MVAIPLGAAALVVAALGQFYLPNGVALGLYVLLDAASVIWLRLVVHVGLLQEAGELPIGPQMVCANCGARTARHTFCSSCGIALAALPKRRTRDATASADES
jgi:hypothetical protein